MKIGLQTWGSEGDIDPFLALAAALSKAGHEVTLAITSTNRSSYRDIAERHNFRLGTVDFIGEDEERLSALLNRIESTSNLFTQMKLVFKEMFEPGVPAMVETARSLCEENELIIGHFIHHPAQAAAEKAGKPYVTLTLNHGAIPTRYSPPIPYPNLGRVGNSLLWRFSERVVGLILLPLINDLRRKEGLKPVKSYREVWESPLCNLIAISPLLCRPRSDWGDNQKVCGFFKLDEVAGKFAVPEGLMDFVSGGPPPVYMTLGSVINTKSDPAQLHKATRLLCDAAKVAGCRAVIQSKWECISDIPEDEKVFRVDSAPYRAVFPKCAAVVHHGGAGTTHTAALCGCPSVVIAHIPDQILWGTELKRVGIGSKVLHRQSASPQKIARELEKILKSTSVRERAAEISQQLEAENGLANAVKIIDGLSRRI